MTKSMTMIYLGITDKYGQPLFLFDKIRYIYFPEHEGVITSINGEIVAVMYSPPNIAEIYPLEYIIHLVEKV